MLDDIKSILSEFGLSTKESDVYLSMLEIGPSSVQDIAKKAGVNRSTTYVMIEALKRHGLISTFEKGKKVMFAAETPHRLIGVIDEEMGKVEAKKQRLASALPRLLAIFNAIEDKPKVRFFEGDESLDLMRREIADMHEPIWEVYAVDEELVKIAKIREEGRIEVSRHATGGRVLMAVKPGVTPPYFNPKGFEIRQMDYAAFPFSGDIAIVGSKLHMITTKSVGLGIIIDSKEIAEIFRAMYQMAWSCATAWAPPAGWGGR
jgi:sugar-specific transcriptional regulator TrmB